MRSNDIISKYSHMIHETDNIIPYPKVLSRKNISTKTSTYSPIKFAATFALVIWYELRFLPNTLDCSNRKAIIHTYIHTYIYALQKLMASYVVTMTWFNWYPPPQLENALSAMEVVVVGMVTFAQPQQEEQLQYAPTTDTQTNT